MTDPLEIAATALTLVSVILSVKRSLWQFPTGVAGTGLGFFVFWRAGLYSSAVLQPFFIAVLIYGWWYWLRGAHGGRPRVRTAKPFDVIVSVIIAILAAWGASWAMTEWTDFDLAFTDAVTLSVSVVAQYLLDRKYLETWPVWLIVNVASVTGPMVSFAGTAGYSVLCHRLI